MKKRPAEPAAVPYGDNEDAEYLDILWGILRHPATCACGQQTRTPFYLESERLKADRKPLCGRCYRENHEWTPGTLWA